MPVWQNVQLSVQPTWLEMHSVPRSASGMYTHSTSCGRPSTSPGRRISHLRVPSTETCSAAISGRASVKRCASAKRSSFDKVVIAAKSCAPRT